MLQNSTRAVQLFKEGFSLPNKVFASMVAFAVDWNDNATFFKNNVTALHLPLVC